MGANWQPEHSKRVSLSLSLLLCLVSQYLEGVSSADGDTERERALYRIHQ
jgi:hypothetical protein